MEQSHWFFTCLRDKMHSYLDFKFSPACFRDFKRRLFNRCCQYIVGIGLGRGTSIRRNETFVQLENYFLDEVGDVAVSGAMQGNCPLVGMCWVYVLRRVFETCEGSCFVSIDYGT